MDIADISGRLSAILEDARRAIDAAATSDELGLLKSRFLGKKSQIKTLQKSLGALSPEERPRVGAEVNKVGREIEELIEARLSSSTAPAADGTLGPDFTLPGFTRRPGYRHPIFTTIDEILAIFLRLGYGVAEGPDIEDDAHNFTDLNFPPDHPARDAQDTFFISPVRDDNPFLLRTHTSPVQIRVMEAMAPPLAVVVPGRTYRSDAPDATHSPVFHQVEGLVIGEGITMAHLKGTLEHFAREFFPDDPVRGERFDVRFRPHFFPFTEPSAEIDVSSRPMVELTEDAAARVAREAEYLEILGAGMVDPNVLEAVCRRRGDRVYDPERVTGFAFGMGVERLAMLRYGIDDLRLFYENDPRFLENFS